MERLTVIDKKRVYLDGDIEYIINLLSDLRDEGWVDITYEYDSESNTTHTLAYKRRLETDAEFDKRLKLLERQKEEEKILNELRNKRDLKEYLRLKNKFEKEAK